MLFTIFKRTALATSSLLFILQADAKTLHNIGRVPEVDAISMGRWVDHPELPVPDSNICNFYAEQYHKKLDNLGYPSYYLYGYAPDGEGHIMVGFDTAGGTVVWDNLHGGFPVSLDQIIKENYILISREIDGKWYYVDG